MTRVVHTGDTHIGYQQYNVPERRQDFLRAFRGVVDDAIETDVDAVVHAGDLFHDRRPGLVDLQGTVEVLRTLAAGSVPFLAVVGNHESKRDAQWLDLFADLGLATRLGPTPTVVDDVAFYGLDFVPRSRREDLEYDFDPVPNDAEAAVLVSHGLFEPFAHADWDTEALLSASTVDFDAVLLGDNHVPDTARVDDTWLTYCGSTERTSASERDDRGYNLVTFDEEVSIARRSVPDTREFVFVDVTLAGDEGVDRVTERVREHDLTDAVVIVTVEGEGDPIAPATVESVAADHGALVARVNDRREHQESTHELSVSFADPDAAVRERVDSLGLSEAARTIDRTVRDEAVPDSGVRETIENRVRDLLERDHDAFAPAPDADHESAGDASDLDDGDEGSDAQENPDVPEEPAAPIESEGSNASDDSEEPDALDNSEEPDAQADSEEPEALDDSEQLNEESSSNPAGDDGEGQVSMGEFQ